LREPPDLTPLTSPETWNLVKTMAPSLGVATHIAHVARAHVAGEDRAWCDSVLVQSWQRHDRSLEELDSVLAILDNAGIPAISLKGTLLARRHYQPYFLRKPSSDIDLAVKNADLERACAALTRAGYTPRDTIREARGQMHHVALTHGSGETVELHFRLSHGCRGIPTEEFFERAVAEQMPSGRSVLILDPADELMHLILHFGQRHKQSHFLHSLYDVRHVWNSASPNLQQEAVDRAVSHRFAGAVSIANLACRSMWGIPLLGPEINPPKTWLNRWMNEELYRKFEHHSTIPTAELTPATKLRGRWLEFRLTDRPSDTLDVLKVLLLSVWYRATRQPGEFSEHPAPRPAR